MNNILIEYIELIGGKQKEIKNYKNKYFEAGSIDIDCPRPSVCRPRYLESYDDYINKIKPAGLKKNKQWVYDIMDGKKEKDKVLYQDEHFLLVPDIKWDGKDKWELKIVAFFKDKELASMRDLTGDHIKLLEFVKNKGCEIIKDKYNLSELQLKIFFHYRPSVWQLHLHFNCLFFKTSSSSIERAHSIYSVIENLKLDPEYFKKVKIHCFNDIQ